MGNHAILEPEDKIFLSYLSRRPNSLGKRFIQYHIQDYGFEAFESFWEKIRAARDDREHGIMEEPKIQLSRREAASLAKALYASTRRDMMKGTIGGVLTAVGLISTAKAGETMVEMAENPPPIPMHKCLEFLAETSIGIPSLILGVGIALKPEPDAATVDSLVRGPEAEAKVGRLVECLDAMFQPVEAVLAESNPRGHFAERAR